MTAAEHWGMFVCECMVWVAGFFTGYNIARIRTARRIGQGLEDIDFGNGRRMRLKLESVEPEADPQETRH